MKRNQTLIKLFITTSLLASILLTAGGAAAAPTASGAVYILSNAADGNDVLAFDRMADGTLVPAGSHATGGLGTGGGLGSQGALVLSEGNDWLFAVNAGSADISVLAVKPDGLELVETEPSGGTTPISLTVHGNLLYVLNAGNGGNISGFRIGSAGGLTPIGGSTQTLSNGGAGEAPGPAQISFTPDGRQLIVTEKATNLIDTFQVDRRGQAGEVVTHASAGETPFGFAFGQHNVLIVSEAFGGAAGASTASSYRVGKGNLGVISAAVPTTQTAACWVAVTGNGRYAYTTNTGSGSVSGYRVERLGNITLFDARAGETGDGSSPIDMAFSGDSTYLYTLNAGTDTISAFGVNPDGSLAALDGIMGLPDGAVGMAAY